MRSVTAAALLALAAAKPKTSGMGAMMNMKQSGVEMALAKADSLLTHDFVSGVACVDGMAGEYPCSNVDLVSFTPRRELYGSTVAEGIAFSDMWGWTDSEFDGHEYVILGALTGTTFVDITDPMDPVVVGFAETEGDCKGNNWWRDMKTVGHYVYIVADYLPGAGMEVVDLTQLRGRADEERSGGGRKLLFGSYGVDAVCNASTVTSSHTHDTLDTAHNVAAFTDADIANGAEPVLIAMGAADADGTQLCGGGLAFFDVTTDPMNPLYLGCYGTQYTHDVQCVLYRGPDVAYQGRELCFCSNENHIAIVDITDKQNAFLVNSVYGCSAGVFSSRQNVYPYDIRCSMDMTETDGGPYHNWKPGFVHQGWCTEDHRYFVLGDEGDEETGLVKNVTSYLFDFTDLDTMKYLGSYTSDYVGIDHNLYIAGDLSYHADYTAGMRIRSTDILSGVEEVGYFDVAPEYVTGYTDGDREVMPEDGDFGWLGAWSLYPYFPSGTVAVSSVDRGLFLLKYTGSA